MFNSSEGRPAPCASGETRAAARARLAAAFRAAGLETPDLDARLLVGAACGVDHVALVAQPDARLGDEEAARLAAMASRRLAREPVSRILGRREFWGMTFAIHPAVLDPRPDTEGLVGAVVDALGGRRRDPLRILDLGTGSGAVLAALLREFPGAYGVAVDLSPTAARVARANFAALGLSDRASVMCGRWCDALEGRFDALVSNPPYIASGEIAGLDTEVRGHDPRLALDGGADGLDAYRAILSQAAGALKPGALLAVEIGASQGEPVATLFRATSLAAVSVLRDLAGLDRVVMGQAAG